MTSALSFGFMHHFVDGYHFERLHIFLFNLCSGGSIILYFTEGQKVVSLKVRLFFVFSFLYAVSAFLKIYWACLILSVFLYVIAEIIRLKKFTWWPYEFFSLKVPTALKFHHASILCMVWGLIISDLAIINDNYFRMVDFEKLTLNTFFLGFSFPVSLISLSVLFNMMHRAKDSFHKILKSVLFWTINLGVVIFFVFILVESAVLELVISIILFCGVSAILYMYIYLGIAKQQKAFLTSGLVFLLMTAVSGIIYILIYFIPMDNEKLVLNVVLKYHAMLALYGWNISGLAVILRFNDFPIRLHEGKIIVLHWLVALVLAPLGYFYANFAIATIILYTIFLYVLFFSKGVEKMPSFERVGK